MERWKFQKIAGNNAVAGIITATSPEATDYEMTEQLNKEEFCPEDNGKIVIIDREKVDGSSRYATVIIAEEAPRWETLTLTNNDPATIQKIESIVKEAIQK